MAKTVFALTTAVHIAKFRMKFSQGPIDNKWLITVCAMILNEMKV